MSTAHSRTPRKCTVWRLTMSLREYGLDWNWTPDLYAELLAISGGRERIKDYGRALRSQL